MSIRYARNDQTGSIFQVSRCKTMTPEMMTPKIKAANNHNFSLTEYSKGTKSGKIVVRTKPHPGTLTMSTRMH